MRGPTTRPTSFALFLAAVAVSAFSTQPPVAAAQNHICSAPRSSSASLGYGTVSMANSCAAASQPALQREIAMLDSFEADAGDFASIARRDPSCALAYWGAAMSARGNPLGGSLDEASLRKGRAYVDEALRVGTVTPREKGLIAAMDIYYRPYKDQIARARAYADRMDALHAAFPDDPDIAAFDGLAIIEGVDLNDRTYSRQKRAGEILEAVMKAHPEHPGAPHYLIHAFDYTALAPLAVHAAEVYPTIATASSHAQHMPAHIWSMLGEWDKSIAANRTSEFLAEPTSGHGFVTGDIVYEHAFDFIAYARLQKGEDKHVAEDLAALKTRRDVPLIVEARYPLERGDWASAAKVPVPVNDVFDAALARFARGYGAARAGRVAEAERELAALKALRDPVSQAAGEYWGQFVDIYAEAVGAWILEARGKGAEALALMTQAADADDGHEKHIYLENKILPMREALGDMQLALHHPQAALDAYRQSMKLAPNRYRSYLGAAQAAEAGGDTAAASGWWKKLIRLSGEGDKARPGYAEAEAYIAGHG